MLLIGREISSFFSIFIEGFFITISFFKIPFLRKKAKYQKTKKQKSTHPDKIPDRGNLTKDRDSA